MTLAASSARRAATRSSSAGGSSSPSRVNPTRSANATVTSRAPGQAAARRLLGGGDRGVAHRVAEMHAQRVREQLVDQRLERADLRREPLGQRGLVEAGLVGELER